jgi:CheY-like chemotaxis protein
LLTRPIGHERILIIEDADPVRALAATVLQRLGYEVLDVPSGEAAERLRARRPSTRVLFMSGYADDTVLASASSTSSAPSCRKPFTPESLASKVRVVLDAPARSPEN